MAESYNRGSNTHTVSFRLEAEGFEKLEQEAHNQGISLNSLMNHIIKNFFDWHIFEPKIGFVPILKPVVEEIFTEFTEEQIARIAASTGKQEFENTIYFMKGKVDLDSFLSWFEARMKNSSIEVNHAFDYSSMMHTYIVKHDICENWSLYLKEIIEHVFKEILKRNVEAIASHSTLTFRFKQEEDY